MSNPIVINPSEVVALSERLGASGNQAQHVHTRAGDSLNCSGCGAYMAALGSQGNQARLNNGCVCDSGCDSCDRLADKVERLERELGDWRAMPLSKRLARETERADDCEKRLERLAESWEAMREALQTVERWLCENTQATNRPAQMDRDIIEALRLADKVSK